LLGASLAFVDQTQARQLRTVLERTNRDLETAAAELQSANEELETTNEELQSTIEELETTNEELQSANEELETMNAELQSTNDELNALNDRLQERSEELSRVNGYFQSVLSGLNAAVVVLDRDLQVHVWSDKAEDLWGLRQTEVAGKALSDLDIGLPVSEVQPMLSECLTSSRGAEVQVKGLNRRGKSHLYRVRCTPVPGQTGLSGLILLIEESA
jgi:two-component system CheB/CheR fusion protein